MKQWINFYNNIDEKTDGLLTKIFFFGILPLSISFVITHFGYLGWQETEIDGTVKYIGVLGLNHLSVIAHAIGGIILISIMYGLGSVTIKWGAERFEGIRKFIDIVKQAKVEEFDKTNLEMNPNQQELNIKA